MFKSMTGFAQRDFERDGLSGSIQIKSYNNRYLDVSVSLPPQASSFEPRIIAMIGERLNRGKVEFSLRLKKVESPVTIRPDLAVADSVYKAMSQIAASCGIVENPSLQLIASFEGVLVYEKDVDSESLWPPIAEGIQLALDEMEASRMREGKATEANILAELARFEASLALVKENAADMDKTIRNQLQMRFEELLPKGYDEQRLLQETAVQLVRLTIAEEIARLDAHVGAFRMMSGEESPAKKLDFLCQEMNREVNTIGSKNTLILVAHAVVEMKDALENIREQLRNVE
ncbi:MAG: YicC family protein [Spirochaetae bacterium HGW-Spirochaetae-9]|nr:MAG: YicC family protein [Spirochaetae bacterium HGW-Spirochaetae-9]